MGKYSKSLVNQKEYLGYDTCKSKNKKIKDYIQRMNKSKHNLKCTKGMQQKLKFI